MKTTTNATANNNPFETLLRTYENATRHRNENNATETAFTDALTDLATACTFSVFKKLCNVGGELTKTTKSTTDTAKPIRRLKSTLARDLHALECLEYSGNNSTALEYNQNGDIVTVVTDKELYTAFCKLCKECLGDGIDLMHTAITTILKETENATDKTANFMETPYTVRRLKKKVYIKDVNSLGGYETVNTTAIQEVYKAIRRDIEDSRSMQVANNKYSYISDILKDTETDTETEVYRRLPKYSGLAYETLDYRPTPTNPNGGKVVSISADTQTVGDIDTLIEKLNLSKQQAQILQLRLSGYGLKAIATYFGVRSANIQTQLKRIQAKAVAVGLKPTSI